MFGFLKRKKHNPYAPFTKEDFDRGFIWIGDICIGLGAVTVPCGTVVTTMIDIETRA